MKKIKGLLFAFVALFAFTLAMVTVSAADEKYGVYTVSEAGKKAEWDFTQNIPQGSNYTVTGVSDPKVYGIGAPATTTKVQFKTKAGDGLSNGGTNGADIYVPVPSADAAGSISFVGNNNSRYVELTVSGGTKIYAKTDGDNATPFTSDDVSESNGHYYLTLVGSSAGAELKAKKITVTLTTGAYEATAAKITVTLKDTDENVLRTDNTVDSGSVYEKGYVTWGYDTAGYFLDKELTQPYNNEELTEDTTLFVGLNPWDGVIANPNHLTNQLVEKLNGVELGNDYPLDGTIYKLLSGTSYATTSDKPCINVSGKVDKTKNGVQVVAVTAGTLIVQMTTGGNSARSASVVNASSGKAVTVASGNPSWDDTAAVKYEVRTLTYNLEAGTYNVGGLDNGMRILSMEFVPGVTCYQDAAYNAEGVELVRYVAVVEGVSEEDIAGNFSLVITSAALDEALDATGFRVIANKLLNGEDPYTIGEVTFEEKEGTLYVVCVLGVSGGELGDDYKDAELTATLTVNGSVVGIFNYTVLGAQAE